MAVFFAGVLDAFHILGADQLIRVVAPEATLVPFTFAISRIFNVIILITGASLFLWKSSEKNSTDPKKGLWFIFSISAVFGLVAFAIMHFCATTSQLPQTQFPNALVTRPWDAIPLVLYLYASVFIFHPFYKKYPNVFSYSLLLSMIPNIYAQLHLAFLSTALYDNHFNIAHFLELHGFFRPLDVREYPSVS